MYNTEPKARLIIRPSVDWNAIRAELVDMRMGLNWWKSRTGKPEDAAEFAGRMCYHAFDETLNQNVSRIREDQAAYFANLIRQGHTSVFEHLSWGFVLTGSRVLTHELIRHRPGIAISQESGRYVRLRNEDMGWIDMPFAYIPDEINRNFAHLRTKYMASLQAEIDTLPWDRMSFNEKKQITSWLRRSFPEGRSTRMVWTANARILRHVIALRTARGAELEIRVLFGQIAEMMAEEAPLLFLDMKREYDEDGVAYYEFG